MAPCSGKKVNARKRNLVVGALGHPPKLAVHPASVPNHVAVYDAFEEMVANLPRRSLLRAH